MPTHPPQPKQRDAVQPITRQMLQEVSRRAVMAIEADRQTVSKEIHDSIGASLAAIKITLEELLYVKDHSADYHQHQLEKAAAYLVDTIKEAKRISANLRPTTLDDLGLLATIKWYLREFGRVHQQVRIETELGIAEADIPEALKINIYRVIQEAFNNIGKHSGSTRASLKLTKSSNPILLIISDNGKGFDINEALSDKDPLSGYGLTAMKERCEIYGGHFQIETTIGNGTRLTASFPVDNKHH
jgi:signal transduction histidine kinase